MMRVGIIGSGEVGRALARAFLNEGYEVMLGSRDGAKAASAREELGDIRTGSFRDVALWSELCVLAVKGSAAEGVVGDIADAIAGKTVIDVTNPISDDPVEGGVLQFFTTLEESLFERLVRTSPQAKFVKAFNTVGSSLMYKPDFAETPTMFYCGDEMTAKETVRDIILRFGWEPYDMGAPESARALEPLCMLWCIPGLRDGKWHHAFRLLEK